MPNKFFLPVVNDYFYYSSTFESTKDRRKRHFFGHGFEIHICTNICPNIPNTVAVATGFRMQLNLTGRKKSRNLFQRHPLTIYLHPIAQIIPITAPKNVPEEDRKQHNSSSHVTCRLSRVPRLRQRREKTQALFPPPFVCPVPSADVQTCPRVTSHLWSWK